MTETSIFELAARKKLRFPSARGDLTVEQLFDLPLTSSTGFDLDTVARGINTGLKETTEESFVDVTPNKRQAAFSLQLDIVKSVISTRQAENERKRKLTERSEQRRKLLEALEAAENNELKSKSKDELLAALDKLDNED